MVNDNTSTRLIATSIIAASLLVTTALLATNLSRTSPRSNLFFVNNVSPSRSPTSSKRNKKQKQKRKTTKDSDTDSESEEEEEKGGKKGDKNLDGKLWEVKKEFYSSENGDWKTVEEKDEDDSDDEEENKLLFVVRQRNWPKSAEYSNFEDYTNIEIRSKHLIDFLRSIPELTEVEEVHEDNPKVNEKDLYLVREALKVASENLKKKETSEEEDSVAEKSTGTQAEDENDAHSQGGSSASNGGMEKSEEELKEQIEHAQVLLKYIDEAFHPTTTKLARLLQLPHSSKPTDVHSQHAQISYQLLWCIFAPNSIVSATDELSGEKYAFKVKSASYTHDRDCGPVFSVMGYALFWNGIKYTRVVRTEKIPKFKALRRLSTLSVVPLSPHSKLYRDLSTRGKTYTTLSGTPKFLTYEGNLTQVIGYGMNKKVNKMRAEGRAVVDAKSFRRMNPMREMDFDSDDDSEFWSDYGLEEDPTSILRHDSSSSSTGSSVSSKDYVLLPPTVFAFSLALREWGDMSVEGFSEIEFRNDAWDRLVIDKDYKELIRSLVGENTRENGKLLRRGKEETEEKGENEPLGDIVEGKGGGLVIALHGLPGVGKTLTAEAVAESLQVPLYTVGAGSLGVTADVLEKRLRDILDIASAWGATLLIDEADVFLEARAKHDIQRNALVSVFLRLLEYHQGVLFLTTNRIRNIDEAFLSRFSLAITYPNLDATKRRVIWCDFLEHARVGIKGTTSTSTSINGSTGKEEGKESKKQKKEFESWLSGEYVDKLSKKKDFNGRIIKNIVRTAQSLSRSQGVPLSERHLDVVIKANEEFVRDYKEADEEGIYEVDGEGWKDHTNVYG